MPDTAMRLLFPLAFAVLFAAPSAALATTQRTFVASTGNDANPCSLPLPCRQFTAAAAMTNAGGEVIVLDSAGYGPVTLTQSISIIAPAGVFAGISVFAGDGVTINGSNIVVVLRGLSINGQGGSNGVTITNAGNVHIENCVISNMAGLGINALAGTLDIKDTIVRNGANVGIFVHGPAHANLDHVRLNANNTGLAAEFGGTASMRDSIVTGSANIGIVVTSPIAASSVITISRSFVTSNNYGLYAQHLNSDPFLSAWLMISDSTISDNTVGIHVDDGGLDGFGWVFMNHNTITANGTGLELVNYGQATLAGNDFSGNLGAHTDIVAGVSSTLFTAANNTYFLGTFSGVVFPLNVK